MQKSSLLSLLSEIEEAVVSTEQYKASLLKH